jgi:hypothetical protein
LGQAYTRPNGIEVTLESISSVTVGIVTTVSISYSFTDPTDQVLPEIGWKLYYKDRKGGGISEIRVYGELEPDQTVTGSHLFNVVAPNEALAVGYPLRFNDKFWTDGDLLFHIDRLLAE